MCTLFMRVYQTPVFIYTDMNQVTRAEVLSAVRLFLALPLLFASRFLRRCPLCSTLLYKIRA